VLLDLPQASRCQLQCGSSQALCPHPSQWNSNLEFHLFPYLYHLHYCLAMYDWCLYAYNRWCALPPSKAMATILLAAFPSTCSLTSLEMSIAVLPVFDCVSTPSVVRQWHGTPGDLRPYSQRQDAGRICLFAPEQQQTPFFLTLIAFYEQASSRTYWLKAFFL